MKDAKDLIPWTVTNISIRPFEGLWSFNPSIHFDGQTWRCVLRCADYAMPEGRTIRSSKARAAGHQTKNAMVVFDPATWKPIQVYTMHERDDFPRAPCANVGFEDMRIFRTDRGGLQGIAASLHLRRDDRRAEGSTPHQPPEQVLLSFDGEYNIVSAKPIRGDWWSGMPQKNWVPFDDCAEPRFLYAINKGTLFDDRGTVHGDAAIARPSDRARPLPMTGRSVDPDRERQERELRERQEREERERHEREEHERQEREDRERAEREERERHEREERERHEREERERRERKEKERRRRQDPRTKLAIRGTDVAMVRGGRTSHDSGRTTSSSSRHVAPARTSDSTRVMGSTGRALPPRYEGLRGGSQLVRVADDAWLGIGHEMRYDKGLKLYWHTWYLTDSRGKMTAASEPMKLVSNGIEFAAGLAIDGNRVVVSFGVDDMDCMLGETKLPAVMEVLRPISP